MKEYLISSSMSGVLVYCSLLWVSYSSMSCLLNMSDSVSEFIVNCILLKERYDYIVVNVVRGVGNRWLVITEVSLRCFDVR